MANFTFTLILLITFSFTVFSTAELENDAINLDIASKKTLLLPSDNPEPEETTTTVGFSEILPENEVPDILPDHPMKIIRIQPINRHFPRSQLGSLRIPLHRCRHGGMGQKPMRPQRVSFGDDMTVVPFGENGDFDTMVKVVPERWIRIHRHHPHHLHHRNGRFPMGKHHDFFADKRFGNEREEKVLKGKRQDFFDDQKFDGREERLDGGFMRNQKFDEREERPDGGFMRNQKFYEREERPDGGFMRNQKFDEREERPDGGFMRNQKFDEREERPDGGFMRNQKFDEREERSDGGFMTSIRKFLNGRI